MTRSLFHPVFLGGILLMAVAGLTGCGSDLDESTAPSSETAALLNTATPDVAPSEMTPQIATPTSLEETDTQKTGDSDSPAVEPEPVATAEAESSAASEPVVKTLAEWVEVGAVVTENKDGTVKSIDFSKVTEPVAINPSETVRIKTLRVLKGKGTFTVRLAEQCEEASDLTEFLWTNTVATDQGLESLAKLKKIKKARLTGLATTPRTAEILASFPALTDLDLSASTLTDAGLTPLAGMKNLTRLNLYQTAVTDAGVESLLPIAKNLQWLNLDATRVTDAVGPTLENFENLTFLHLGRTSVTDAMIDSLAHLTKLETIHVTRTAITEAGANRLREKLPETDVISVVEDK